MSPGFPEQKSEIPENTHNMLVFVSVTHMDKQGGASKEARKPWARLRAFGKKSEAPWGPSQVNIFNNTKEKDPTPLHTAYVL